MKDVIFNLDWLHANIMFTNLFEYLYEDIYMNLPSIVIVFKKPLKFSVSKRNYRLSLSEQFQNNTSVLTSFAANDQSSVFILKYLKII